MVFLLKSHACMMFCSCIIFLEPGNNAPDREKDTLTENYSIYILIFVRGNAEM